MRRVLAALYVIAAIAAGALAQANWPALPYLVDPDWPRLPAGWTFEETPGVAVDAKEHVFVFHRGKHSIIEFDKVRQGRPVGLGQSSSGEGEFNLPHAVAVDKNGRVYVGDRENHRMQIFDTNGKFITQWKHVGSPWGIVITSDEFIYMCDGHNNRILKLNLKGEILGVLGSFGKLPGQLDFVHHMAIGPSGSIYAAEIKNWRVQKFAPR